MTLESAVIHFGYPAVLLGTFFEGEIILIMGGFAAHRGYLQLPLVILAAFTGSLLGDQVYFHLGRHRGTAFLSTRPGWAKRTARFTRLLDRHNVLVILIFRFLYGLRTVAPFAIGLSSVSAWKFTVLNMISAALWAAALGVLGFFFGHAMEAALDDIKRYEILVMCGLALLAAVIYAVRRIKRPSPNDS